MKHTVSQILHSLLARKKLAITKVEWHGIDFGPAYTTDNACATFVEFIALEQKQQLLAALSLQVDARTDAGMTKDELFLMLDLAPHCGKVHRRECFLIVRQLTSGTAQGLFDCLTEPFHSGGVTG